LVNEPPDKGWEQISNYPKIQIYKKSIKGNPSIMIKTIAVIDGYSKTEVFEAIANANVRTKWDKIFSDFTLVSENRQAGTELVYTSIKVNLLNLMFSLLVYLCRIEILYKKEKFGKTFLIQVQI
jgi:hypothetical protein